MPSGRVYASVGLLFFRPVNGSFRSIGCRLCTNACALGNMSYSPRLRKVFKCDQCGGDPKCVRYCPGGALAYEDADRMDPRKKQTADKIVAAMGMEV